MIFGYDVNNATTARCLAKTWESSGISVSVMLYGTGSGVDSDTICDGIPTAVNIADAHIRLCLEEIAQSTGASDLAYVSTTLLDHCQEIHKKILDISDFIGQGIYIGGAIIYGCADKILLCSFGGTAIYSWQNNELVTQGNQAACPFAQNAIGGSKDWNPYCWHISRSDNVRLICTCKPLSDLHISNEILRTQVAPDSHVNTASMLLRRELERQSLGGPAAVMDFRC